MDIQNLGPKEIIEMAEKQAKLFREDRLKTNQIRNFYAAITRMRTKYDTSDDFNAIERDLVMLKPKLAYAAGRQKAVRKHFYPFMRGAIESVINAGNKPRAIGNFFSLVEGVVAYHKFFGD